MKKTLVSFVLVLAVAVASLSFLTACAGPEAPATTPSTGTTTPTIAPTTTPSVPAEKPIVWREVTTLAPGTEGYKIVKAWADAVTVASNGRLVMQHYGPGEIVTEVDFMEALNRRLIEVASGDYSKGGEFPVGAPYASMPGGVSMIEWAALDYDFGGKEFLQSKVYDRVGITYLGGIAQHGCAINTNRPITALSDIKGMKIRDFGLKGELCKKLGFEVTYIPFNELYLAISTGVVDGQNQLYSNIIENSFYEVAKYLTLPNTVPYLGAGGWASMEAFNELDASLQTLVVETYKAFSYRFTRDQAYKEVVSLAQFAEHGGTIYQLSDADVLTMKKKAVEVWNEAAAKDALSAEFINMYKAYMVKLGYEIPS